MSVWLEGRLARVVWASADTGYAVLRVLTPTGEEVAVGTLAALAEQAEQSPFVSLEGRWEQHPVHGRQFKATGWLQGSPRTEDGIRLYLASAGVPGIGPVLAARIVDHFGISTPRVLAESPERLADVKGISKARANAIATAWSLEEDGRALSMLLRGLGLPARIVERIRRRYGESAAEVVRREPYRLAEEIPGVGFRTADALAREQGLPPDHPGRVRAAVLHVLRAQAQEGHCYLPLARLTREVAALSVPTDTLQDALHSCEVDGRVVCEDDDRVWPTALQVAERQVAAALRRRAQAAAPLEAEPVDAAARYEGVTLDPLQHEAVRTALGGGVTVITGGPGTGKTTLLRVMLRAARERGERWLLASPTGRAARRLEEATGEKAVTVHRLLEYKPGEGGFQRDAARPLEGDGLVVDEASMVDLLLARALLDALPQGVRFSLVLVGDADQLPSVGPGQVLRDVIASGVVPVVRLSRIYRQAERSGIVQAARDIHDGEVPLSGELVGAEDFFLLGRDAAARAVDTLLQVVAERLPGKGFDPLQDVQVLAPTRRGPLGTAALNEALQARLNPDGPGIRRGGREIRVGDRVICVRNRYDVEVFNGDVGRVLRADAAGLLIDFDGRPVPWAWDDLPLIELAYAITVHKSQGSEYPAVVLALHTSHGVMLRRNLFYTAVTRASRFLCVVGSARAWWRAVAQVGGDERHTALAERLGRDEEVDDEVPWTLWEPE